jgi:hypothetical protein
MKGDLLWMVPLAHHAGTRDICPAWAAFVDPVQKIFSLPYTTLQTIFHLCIPRKDLAKPHF